MGSFDQGYAGMVSLRAVNEWIGVINSNLGGSNRTAYKATKVSFGGGVAQILRDPRQESNGIQLPDSTLTVSHTRIDFTQGTVIQDGELTHVAISGDAFFAVSDGLTVFFTRDGEFRWTQSGANVILTTAGGLTVLSVNAGANASVLNAPIVRVGSGATFSLTVNSVTGAAQCIAVYRFANNQALKFSKFGSTVFDAVQAAPANIVTDVEIIQSALEASNSALNDTLPELSLAQKLFSAVSKIINVHNSNLDIVVNLIR
jgi:flagellar basal body rod protein FlgG